MASGTTLAGTGVDTFKYGIVNNGNSFFGFIRALRDHQLVKVMADPTVVAIDGRPASFNSGGEFPILVPAALAKSGLSSASSVLASTSSPKFAVMGVSG